VSTSKEDFLAPREPDGSLPKNGFGKLVDNSFFIDKGTSIVRGINPVTLKSYDFSIPYFGAAPDLGAFEHLTPTGVPQIVSSDPHLKAYPNPFYEATTFDIIAFESGNAQLNISDLTGKIVYATSISGLMQGEKRTVRFNSQLISGVYLVNFINGNHSQILKLIKLDNK